jgi:phosphate/sulfate permease
MVQGAVKLGCPPDFVSSHLYPTDPWAFEKPLAHGRADFAKAIGSAADIVIASAKKAGMATVPQLLITEFNCGLGMNCAGKNVSSTAGWA